MRSGQEVARSLVAQEPSRMRRHAIAAGASNIAEQRGKSQTEGSEYCVLSDVGKAFSVLILGRDAWALNQLRDAGAKGCSTVDNPAPRWSAYIFALREPGVDMKTRHEVRADDFPGHHARCVLRPPPCPCGERGCDMTGNRKARRAWAAALKMYLKRGRVYLPEIQHDKWCGIYSSDRQCHCDPIRVLKDDTGRVLARVEGAGPYDPLEWVGGWQ